ncbi:MAG: hypothetical protein U5R48_08195 [Gammaproteobacteria bacterium]|nr:hypothetical protein [Gammaproteobacteria bacterium]
MAGRTGEAADSGQPGGSPYGPTQGHPEGHPDGSPDGSPDGVPEGVPGGTGSARSRTEELERELEGALGDFDGRILEERAVIIARDSRAGGSIEAPERPSENAGSGEAGGQGNGGERRRTPVPASAQPGVRRRRRPPPPAVGAAFPIAPARSGKATTNRWPGHRGPADIPTAATTTSSPASCRRRP